MLRVAICNSRARASAIGSQARWASSDKPAAGPKEAGKEANATAGKCCLLSCVVIACTKATCSLQCIYILVLGLQTHWVMRVRLRCSHL